MLTLRAEPRLPGPVTLAIRSTRAEHEPDPHCAYEPALREAYAEAVAARPFDFSDDAGSAGQRAACLTERRYTDLAHAILCLPTPQTTRGLAVLGLAAALLAEGAVSGPGVEREQFALVALARTILALTGATPPNVYPGFGDEPDYAVRKNATCVGPGIAPVWTIALAEAAVGGS